MNRLSFVSILFLVLNGLSNVAGAMEAKPASTACQTTDPAALSVRFNRLREKITNLDQKNGVLIGGMSAELESKGKWSERNEASFFKSLVASTQYQSFETQRGDLVSAYMLGVESLLTAISEQQVQQTCQISILIETALIGMYSLTEAQWEYMFAEKRKALKTAASRSQG